MKKKDIPVVPEQEAPSEAQVEPANQPELSSQEINTITGSARGDKALGIWAPYVLYTFFVLFAQPYFVYFLYGWIGAFLVATITNRKHLIDGMLMGIWVPLLILLIVVGACTGVSLLSVFFR